MSLGALRGMLYGICKINGAHILGVGPKRQCRPTMNCTQSHHICFFFYLLRVGFMLHLNTTALNMAGSANLWCNMIECMFEMLARFLLTHDCMIMFHYTAMPLRGN